MTDSTDLKKEELENTKKIIHSYPLVKSTDMNEEMVVETVELCVTACEKHSANNEMAAKMIKDNMDRKYGMAWHVVIGEGFGLEVTHEMQTLLYMFFAGNLAVCLWKCS